MKDHIARLQLPMSAHRVTYSQNYDPFTSRLQPLEANLTADCAFLEDVLNHALDMLSKADREALFARYEKEVAA